MSSTISTSTIITSSTLSSYSWPVTINTSGVVVTLGSDITLTSNNQYFIIGGSNITFVGSNFRVYISNVGSYPGLISNPNLTCTNITILNLLIISSGSTLSSGSGWVCQSGFLNGTVKF